MSSPDDLPDQAPHEGERAPDDHVVELLARAREACAGRPDLEAALERVSGLDRIDLEHHPAEFDAVHGVLREALANAGRQDVARPS